MKSLVESILDADIEDKAQQWAEDHVGFVKYINRVVDGILNVFGLSKKDLEYSSKSSFNGKTWQSYIVKNADPDSYNLLCTEDNFQTLKKLLNGFNKTPESRKYKIEISTHLSTSVLSALLMKKDNKELYCLFSIYENFRKAPIVMEMPEMWGYKL